MTAIPTRKTQPFLLGCAAVWGFGLPVALCFWSSLRLIEDYRFLGSAAERATAILTRNDSGDGVLRFWVEGRMIDVRGGPASSVWGSPFEVRFPRGQPERARTQQGIDGRLRQSWFLLAGGLILQVVVIVAWWSIKRQERNATRGAASDPAER